MLLPRRTQVVIIAMPISLQTSSIWVKIEVESTTIAGTVITDPGLRSTSSHHQQQPQRHQFSVATDRSQGDTSHKNGQIELMVHRQLLADDLKGVGEALNETSADGQGFVVTGVLHLLLDTVEDSVVALRERVQAIQIPLLPMFQAVSMPPSSSSPASMEKSID